MNFALYCADIWYRLDHFFFLTGAIGSVVLFTLISLLFYWSFRITTNQLYWRNNWYTLAMNINNKLYQAFIRHCNVMPFQITCNNQIKKPPVKPVAHET